MIKLRDIINGEMKDCVLYEGLIYTVEINTAVDHLKRWSISKNKFDCEKTAINTIELKFKETITEKEFNSLFKLIYNLGWYISEYYMDDGKFRSFKKFDEEKLKNDILKYRLLGLKLEAKYDIEINKYDISELYHITAETNKRKIDKIGLTPKTKSKIGYHPDRIYFTKKENDISTLGELFNDINYSQNFVVYKIDIDGLLRYNNGIRFFKDPNLGSGVYTLSNVPPKFLSLYKTIKYD